MQIILAKTEAFTIVQFLILNSYVFRKKILAELRARRRRARAEHHK